MSTLLVPTTQALFSLAEATKLLGGISIWTLRKHLQRKHLQAVRIGRRVFLSAEALSKVQREGLPSLGQPSQN